MSISEARADGRPIPHRAWISGILLSFSMSGFAVLAFPIIGPAPVTTHVVPPVLVVLAAFAFAAFWPGRPWFWGVILSSGFWVYFLVVFISYLSIGQWDGTPLARALMVLLAGIGGAAAAAWMRTARHHGRTRD